MLGEAAGKRERAEDAGDAEGTRDDEDDTDK
jgi:hypothetical protein